MIKKDQTELEEKNVREKFLSIPHYQRPATLSDHVLCLDICRDIGGILMAVFCCIPFILFFSDGYEGLFLGSLVFNCIGFLLVKKFRDSCLSMNTLLSRYGLILYSRTPIKEQI